MINLILNHLGLLSEAKRHNILISFSNITIEKSILWKFSLPALLAGCLVNPVNWICSALLVNQPHGYEEMAIYNATNQWYILLLFLPRMLGQVLLPVLSERLGQKDNKQSSRTIILSMKINFILILPLVLIASIFSQYIMGLYGDGFKNGWPTLVIVVLTAGIIAIQTPIGHTIAAYGKMWIGFAMNMGWAIIFLTGTILLVDKGSLGLVLARGFAYLINSVWGFIFIYKFFNINMKNNMSIN